MFGKLAEMFGKKPGEQPDRENGGSKKFDFLAENAIISAGWEGSADMDLSCLMLDESGTVPGLGGFVFYNRKISDDGCAMHAGDDRKIPVADDDSKEFIFLRLADMGRGVKEILIFVSRHGDDGSLGKTVLKLSDNDSEEVLHSVSFSSSKPVLAYAFVRKGDGWNVEARMETFERPFEAVLEEYGVKTC